MYRISNLKGYEDVLDIYFITEEGKVYSSEKDDFLKVGDNGRGYKVVSLKIKNKRIWKKSYVHRLVAQAFINNKENKREVNHINEIKSDNRKQNLEWVTRKENMNHGTLGDRISERSSASKIYVYDFKGVFLSEEISLVKATMKYLGFKETRARNKRVNNYFFLENKVDTPEVFLEKQNKYKTVVLIDTLKNTYKLYPSPSEAGFKKVNKSDWINKKRLTYDRYKLEYYDFKTYAELTSDSEK